MQDVPRISNKPLDCINKFHEPQHFAAVGETLNDAMAYLRPVNQLTKEHRLLTANTLLIKLNEILQQAAHFVAARRCLHHQRNMLIVDASVLAGRLAEFGELLETILRQIHHRLVVSRHELFYARGLRVLVRLSMNFMAHVVIRIGLNWVNHFANTVFANLLLFIIN